MRCLSITCSSRVKAIRQTTRFVPKQSRQARTHVCQDIDKYRLRARKANHVDERWTWSIFLAGIIHRAWAVLSGRCFSSDGGSGRFQEICHSHSFS